MYRKYMFLIILASLIGIIIFWSYSKFNGNTHYQLLTYFQYTPQETSELTHYSTSLEMTPDELREWDTILFDLTRKNKLDADSSRIYAYVYTAQRDAAFLSYNAKKKFAGSIGPVTKMVLCQFFPKDCNMLRLTDSNEYSQKLADMVFNKIKPRIQKDMQQEKQYAEKKGADYWAGNKPYFGQTFGSWKTWLIASGNQFRIPAPPAYSEWQNQVLQVKQQRSAITEEQKILVVYWAGGPGTITPPGIWLAMMNQYMWDHHVPLQKIFLVRSILSMAMADAIIAAFDSKYTYYQLRPYMRDKTIQPIMPTPNHPSYPAAHSTVSATAANILSYYFPKEKNQWMEMAKIASKGRVWGGIHFPVDTVEGESQGKKIADFIVQHNPYGIETHE